MNFQNTIFVPRFDIKNVWMDVCELFGSLE